MKNIDKCKLCDIKQIIDNAIDKHGDVSEPYLMMKCKITFSQAEKYIKMFTWQT